VLDRPAGELAALVRSGEVSSRELVEASLERIGELNGELNAFIHVDAEGALATADAVSAGDERPFAGVPIAIKDTAAVEGLPFSLGSELFGDFVPAHDAFVVRRLREAGFVIVGKTNTPELGLMPSAEPLAYGPTHNPWDLTRSAGGSSGGSAAAVAAGLVPVAHAGDGGGSIRIPASMCGLFGLKPSRGRISLGPTESESWGGLVMRHVVTRSVRDSESSVVIRSGSKNSRPVSMSTRPAASRAPAAFISSTDTF